MGIQHILATSAVVTVGTRVRFLARMNDVMPLEVSLASSVHFAAHRAQELSGANTVLAEVCAIRREYWNGVFTGCRSGVELFRAVLSGLKQPRQPCHLDEGNGPLLLSKQCSLYGNTHL